MSNSQDQPPEIIQTSEDVKSVIKSRITQRWQDLWSSQNGNKLRMIRDSIQPWPRTTTLTRRDEVVLTSLRIGHSRLTHSYLFSRDQPPVCQFCNTEQLTIKHLLTQCTNTLHH